MTLAHIVHHHVLHTIGSQILGQFLSQLLSVTIHAAIHNHYALVGIITAQAVVNAHNLIDILSPYRTVG